MKDVFFGKTVGFRRRDVLYYQAFDYQGKPRVRIGLSRPSSNPSVMFGGNLETEVLLVAHPTEALDALAFLRGEEVVTEAQLLDELGKGTP